MSSPSRRLTPDQIGTAKPRLRTKTMELDETTASSTLGHALRAPCALQLGLCHRLAEDSRRIRSELPSHDCALKPWSWTKQPHRARWDTRCARLAPYNWAYVIA